MRFYNEDEEDIGLNNPDEANDEMQEIPNENGNRAANKAADKAKDELNKKLAEKAGKKVATKSSLAAAMGPIIFWATIIIVAIIVIIGIIMFFMTMPGMVMEKLKAILKEAGNYIAAFFGADTTEQIDDIEIFETLNYLEEMGYDLKGFGFLTGYYENESDITSDDRNTIAEELNISSGEVSSRIEIDEEMGVVRDKETGKVVLAKSDFIFTYIASDNYVYTLKNSNYATVAGTSGFFARLFGGITTAYYKMVHSFYGPIFDLFGVTNAVGETWGKGLLALYYDNGLGKKGTFVNTDTIWNGDVVKIDTETKQLVIGRNKFLNKNNPLVFSLDGWTGRYGMPIEFLLSIHGATMMPDLAYDMTTSFPTEVRLYLHEANGTVDSAFLDGNKYVAFQTVFERVNGNGLFSSFDDIVWNNSELKIAADEFNAHATPCDCNGNRIGRNCKEFVKAVIAAAREMQDNSYLAYLPYIANVQKHWYRDVYFVIDYADEEMKDLAIIDLDYDYESLVRERWTLYEVDNDNNLKLYVVNDEGEFADSAYITEFKNKLLELEQEATDPDAKEKIRKKIEEVDNKVIQDDKFSGMYRYIDTKEKAVELGLAVAKKAIEITTDDFEDLKWQNLSGDLWLAYDEQGKMNYTGYEPAYSYDELREMDEFERSIKRRIYTKVSFKTGNIIQKGDGVRSVTNPEIKRMFLTNTYFRYDGNQGAAEAITKLRGFISKEIQNKYGFKNGAYGALNEEQINSNGDFEDFSDAIYDENGNRIESIEYNAQGQKVIKYKSGTTVIDDPDNPIETYNVNNYSGQVTLNQDSLNAFSMLENTHTLDADYIYRDFKELVVELGYFEKQELSDEAPRILQWLVPETGSDGYPSRDIDKRENEIGSMIHSEGDLDAQKINTMVTQIVLSGMYDPEEPSTVASGVQIPTLETVGETISSEISDGVQEELIAGIDLTTVGRSTAAQEAQHYLNLFRSMQKDRKDPMIATVTVSEFLRVARNMCEEMNFLGYDYCVGRTHLVNDDDPAPSRYDFLGYGPCTPELCDCTDETCPCNSNPCPCCDNITAGNRAPARCNHCICCAMPICDHVHGHPCGLADSFEASKASEDLQNVCCNQLVYWVLKDVGVTFPNGHGISEIGRRLMELGGEIIDEFEDLKPGDIMYYGADYGGLGHIDILGEELAKGKYIKYNGGHYASIGIRPSEFPDLSAVQDGRTGENEIFDESDWDDGVFAIRVFDEPEGDVYEGYHGNEAVVAPATGILLEYGTYEPDITTGKHIDSITQEAYRVNVDMKYGPLNGKIVKDKTQLQQGGEPFVPQTYTDKVGYAKMLVLDTEHYQILESSTPNSWRNNSLVNENGTFRDTLLSTNDKRAAEILHDWSDIDELVYGYKEFVECYEEYGIAGYIIYIDGFVCEEPDPTILVEDAKNTLPQGEKIEFSDFTDTITVNSFHGGYYGGNTLPSLYEPDPNYKMASTFATEKMDAEIQVKYGALSSIYLEYDYVDENGVKQTKKLPYIKEGTVIGRTMTDTELIENRIEEYVASGGTSATEQPLSYEELRPSMDNNYEKFDQVIGNYLRIIMRDLDGTPVENVEDYLKLDDVEEEVEWELFYWLPFESGGQDLEGHGPEAYSSCSPGEVGNGCIQETELVSSGLRNVTEQLIPFCVRENPGLCAPLLAYADWTPTDFWNDYCGAKEFGKTLSDICDVNREEFFMLQLEEAKEYYYYPLIKQYPWVESRPLCVQAAILHYKVWTGNVNKLNMEECARMPDEEILYRVRWAIANTGSTVGPPTGDEESGRAWNEPEIGLGILAGKLSGKEIEEWIRTGDVSILTQNGIEWR